MQIEIRFKDTESRLLVPDAVAIRAGRPDRIDSTLA